MLVRVVLVLLAVLAWRGARWAYVAFILLGLSYFPAPVGLVLHPRACELALDAHLVAVSLTNYAHIVLFAIFCVLSAAHARHRMSARGTVVFAAAASLVMGALVEMAEGLTGNGHCRVRDLIPDSAGILLGVMAFVLWQRLSGTISVRREASNASRRSDIRRRFHRV